MNIQVLVDDVHIRVFTLPKRGTLPINESLFFSLSGLQLLVLLLAQLMLNHKAKKSVVWRMSCSEGTSKTQASEHGVELHGIQIESAKRTFKVVFFSPLCMIEIWFSTKRVQHTDHALVLDP